MSRLTQLHRSLAVTTAICAIAAPAASAAPDPRPVSVRDAAAVRIEHGLRSPNTRDTAIDHGKQDLRSPDTRDGATGAFGAPVPAWPVSVSTSAPSPEPVTTRRDDHLPWLLGAAVGLLGCAVVLRHSLRRRQRVVA